jgi:uncharacterized lipoprotein YddW (UPF0748 family)
MLKLFCCFLILQIVFSPASSFASASPRRGLFVSVIQDPPVLSNRADMERLLDFAVKARINILFVQVYRAGRAWFPSRGADASPYYECLDKAGVDPLAFLIEEAHKRGIEVHAWMNMLSLSRNENAFFLRKYGTGVLTRNILPKNVLRDYRIDGQYFLEPGDLRVREELCDIVEEAARYYPALDGIQLDYIRYPDSRPFYGHTSANEERFKKETGIESITEDNRQWRAWKRAQVTDLLDLLVRRIRSVRPGIKVSATGCAPYCRAYEEAFQDWPSWLSRGTVDFVTLMDYSPYPREFKKCILELRDKFSSWDKVTIGIGAYKLVGLPLTFSEELDYCRRERGLSYAVFHYGSLLEDPAIAGLMAAEH